MYLPDKADTLGLRYTYAFGMADTASATLTIQPVAEIANAFNTNLIRLKSMMMFPAYLADFASVIHRLQLRAHYEKFGDLDIEGKSHDRITAEALFDRFRFLFSEHNSKLACTRFRRHQVRCFYGTGGESWRGEDLGESSSLRRCG
jgi:hypothetical protein